MNLEPKIEYINVEDIIPNRFQPRLSFDENALKELASSIKEHGIIQPLVLRRLLSGKYEIIAGERRYKASQIAGLEIVPAIIADLDDNASAEVALVENLQRKNLSAIEEAKSYKKLLDRGYLTQEQLAKRLGVSQSGVANKVRLLNLTDEVQDALMNELISERHARSLLQLTNPQEQINMLNKIITNRLTVRQLDNEIKNILNGIETLDLNEKLDIIDIIKEPEEEKYEEISNIIDNTKKELDNQFEVLNIPTAEEVKNEVIEQLEEKQEDKSTSTNNDIVSGNIDSVIEKIKDIESQISKAGFQIETENYDFEDLYQIIIKIEK